MDGGKVDDNESQPRGRFKRKFGDAKFCQVQSADFVESKTLASASISTSLVKCHSLVESYIVQGDSRQFIESQTCKMLSRRLATARPLTRSLPSSVSSRALGRIRCLSQAEVEDPNMNGGYPEPPRVNRQNRDPYGDWWDKQERRNFGEPLHEDNDILGIFSLQEYKHVTPGKGALQLLAFIGCVYGLYVASSFVYPDRPSAAKEYEGGLEKELGGEGAVRARMEGDN